MAYPAYAGHGGIVDSGGASVDIPYPSTVNENDILVILVLDADNDTFSIPTGDTTWYRIHNDSANGNASYDTFWTRALGSESGTINVASALTAGLGVYGIMYRFSGCVESGTPFEDPTEIVISQSTSPASSLITTLGTERLAICLVAIEDNITMTGHSNYIDASQEQSTLGGDANLILATQEVASAGDVTAEVWSAANDYWGSVTLALKPIAIIATPKSVSDSGVGSDSVSIKNVFTVSDIGSGVDSIVSILNSFIVSETGSGSDEILLKLFKLILDVGSGSDDVTVAAGALPVNVSDVGTGVDAVSLNIAALITDAGSGNDTLSLIISFTLSESGSGVDVVNVVTGSPEKNISDSGVGSDSINLNISTLISDSGIATDQLSLVIKLSLSDLGSGIDNVSVEEAATFVDLFDSGSAVDVITNIINKFTIQEIATGVDSTNIKLDKLITDSGLGVDSVIAGLVVVILRKLKSTMRFKGVSTTMEPKGIHTTMKPKGIQTTMIIKRS